jgi:alpha-galactosidase
MSRKYHSHLEFHNLKQRIRIVYFTFRVEQMFDGGQLPPFSGLIHHGWTYINIDDAWQGKRGGPFNAIQGNDKFPDLKGLCDEIHKMGLKIGIYSTPWVTSYAQRIGGSAENPEGTWSKPTIPKKGNVNNKTDHGRQQQEDYEVSAAANAGCKH